MISNEHVYCDECKKLIGTVADCGMENVGCEGALCRECGDEQRSTEEDLEAQILHHSDRHLSLLKKIRANVIEIVELFPASSCLLGEEIKHSIGRSISEVVAKALNDAFAKQS